ncbi:MAG: alpha/beta hydrolase [Planctomycetia bacterium]|nr:alpha/beta hydrolase [Planctomycetia bacterium]
MARRFPLLLVALLLMAPALARAAEDQFFDSDGVKIHYIVEGQGEPVLLIHGFTANIDVQWGLPGIIRELAKDYKVIALDNRGHGKSGKPHDPKQYGEQMVEDSIRLLNHLKIDKAHIVGYSMGGFITNKLISVHPDRALTATLGGAGWAQADDQRLAFLTNLAESLDAGKGIGPLIEQLTPPGKPKPTEEQMSGINQMIMLMNDPKALAACIRGMQALAVPEAKLKENKVPTLALIGEIDPLKIGVDELEPRMKNLRVIVIDGADHMNAFSNKAFIGGLKEFLAANAKNPKPAAAAAGSN